ncbi:MAG TPA: hypothetical protein VGR57_17600, partial [Ktedonobacterales bacterium]|nr:hypothetical protein [Ktedonobacterales bacterium]
MAIAALGSGRYNREEADFSRVVPTRQRPDSPVQHRNADGPISGEPATGRAAPGIGAALVLRARMTVVLSRLTAKATALAQRGWRAGRSRWSSPSILTWRARLARWTDDLFAGIVILVGGVVGITLMLLGCNRWLGASLPNPGTLYLPLIGMLIYHWGWRHGLAGGALALACVYLIFIPPGLRLKPLQALQVVDLSIFALATGLVLAMGQLARSRQRMVEREAGRFAALNHVGGSLAGELRERPLLNAIAATARDLTGAEFAAFTLRPLDEHGLPQVPAEGHLFHLGAVVGVTPEQERLFRHLRLGGEGVLAPIFHHGLPVLVADVLQLGEGGIHRGGEAAPAPAAKMRDPLGKAPSEVEATHVVPPAAESTRRLRYGGVPHGHPIVRSFLG